MRNTQGRFPDWLCWGFVWAVVVIIAVITSVVFNFFVAYMNSDVKPQSATVAQLEERVKKLEEKQAGLFEVAVTNAEITGINTGNITNLRKLLDALVGQIDIILDIIQRNAVSLLELPLQSSR